MDNAILYDRETLSCMAGFDALWSRVTGVEHTHAPASPGEDTTLRALTERELEAAHCYSRLSRSFSGQRRALLSAFGADAARRARRLKGEYFIRTGEQCLSSPGGCQGEEGLLSLRRMHLKELERSRLYTGAAQSSRCPVLRELYNDFARETAERAEGLREMILKCF